MTAQIRLPPFSNAEQLTSIDDSGVTIFLEDENGVPIKSVEDLLLQELSTPVVDDLYPHLWFFAKKSSSHIDPIHQHQVKQRSIIVSEDPALHLVWFYKSVYLKPIPRFLFSHAFWLKYLIPQDSQASNGNFAVEDVSHVCRTALGFLRSYTYLIQHESDYRLAQSYHLIPPDISFPTFFRFIRRFRLVLDLAASPRYHFGQFRLTRLNYAVRLLPPYGIYSLITRRYHRNHMQTGQYIQRFGAPILFVFAAISLILSAMQVVATALGERTWEGFVRASWGFSVGVIIGIVGLVVVTAGGVIGFWISQLRFAVRMKGKEEKEG